MRCVEGTQLRVETTIMGFFFTWRSGGHQSSELLHVGPGRSSRVLGPTRCTSGRHHLLFALSKEASRIYTWEVATNAAELAQKLSRKVCTQRDECGRTGQPHEHASLDCVWRTGGTRRDSVNDCPAGLCEQLGASAAEWCTQHAEEIHPRYEGVFLEVLSGRRAVLSHAVEKYLRVWSGDGRFVGGIYCNSLRGRIQLLASGPYEVHWYLSGHRRAQQGHLKLHEFVITEGFAEWYAGDQWQHFTTWARCTSPGSECKVRIWNCRGPAEITSSNRGCAGALVAGSVWRTARRVDKGTAANVGDHVRTRHGPGPGGRERPE